MVLGGLLLLLLAMLAPGLAQTLPDGSVTVDGKVYRALIAEPEPEPDPRSRYVIQDRDVRLRWDGEVLRVRAVWTVRAKEKTWFSQPLAGAVVRVDRVSLGGRRADTRVEGDQTWLTAEIDGTTRIVLDGAVEGDPTRGALPVVLMGGQLGRVRVAVPEGLEGRIVAPADVVEAEDRWITTAESLSVRVGPPERRARDRRTLAVGSVGMGLTVGDGSVDGRAQLRWTLRQGQLREVRFRAPGVGPDLEVTGSNVGRVERQGERVVVTLREPETARVDIALSWSVPVPGGDTSQLPVPRIVPEGVFRSESSVQLARDGSLDLLPEMGGWQPIAAQDLPEWGDDLVAGTPTAAYRAGAAGKPGTLGLLRFVPATSPPVVVDVASLTIATSAEGRTLIRGLYTVRNERASHLAITPPSDAIILGVRVNDGPVTPVSDGERWLVPLPRSLETLDGLVSFPVEVVLFGDGERWVRKEARDLRLPTVSAPVAVNRVTLHLPPTFDNELEEGAAGTVEDFTEGEGIAYGFGLGGEEEAVADQYWQDAQAAFMRNDFDEADQLLYKLDEIGASNENIGKLRSNLDVLQGRGGKKAKTITARRVRDQAKSRGQSAYFEQEELLREAEEELASGSYSSAVGKYEKVAELAKKLDKLEQEESFEQKARLDLVLKNVEQANSGMALQQALEGKDQTSADRGGDEIAAAEEDRRLRALFDEANGRGWVTSAADKGEVQGADGTVSRFAQGRVSLEGRLSFEPEPEESGLIGGIIEDAKREDARILSESLDDEDGDLIGLDGVGDGFGAKGTGAGGGGLSMNGELGAEAPPPEPSPDVAPPRSTTRRAPQASEISRSGATVTLDAVAAGSSGRGVRIGGGRGRGRNRGSNKAKKSPKAGPAPATPEAVDLPVEDAEEERGQADDFIDEPEDNAPTVPAGYQREALEVTSTRLSVVVPVQGETLRYQHLLLPAGAEHAVRIEARSTERHIPRRLP